MVGGGLSTDDDAGGDRQCGPALERGDHAVAVDLDRFHHAGDLAVGAGDGLADNAIRLGKRGAGENIVREFG